MAQNINLLMRDDLGVHPSQYKDFNEYWWSISLENNKNAEQLIQYFVFGLFGLGLFLANLFNTWLLGLGLGGITMIFYIISRYIVKKFQIQKYITSIIIGMLSVQVFYQMHGLPALNYAWFLGLVLLLFYGDWRVFIPFGIMGLLHLTIYSYLANQGSLPAFMGVKVAGTHQSLVFGSLLFTISTIFSALLGAMINGLKYKNAVDEFRNAQILAKDEKNIQFAREIASGNFDAPYELSEDDSLGHSLLEMSKNLKESAREDERRNWSVAGIAKTEDILRKAGSDIDELAYQVISHLVNYMEANQGGLFVLNDEEEENKFLELKGSYAFGRKKQQQKKIEIGEGLVGQVFVEEETIYMKEIPQDYLKITSGLGDAPPRSLIIVPLKINEEIVGAIELASFREFAKHEKEFLQKVSESIASTIINSKRTAETNRLLEDSQQMTEQMRAQEEEMRQNMEELQATQENLERKNEEQEKTQEQLAKEKFMLDSLMAHTPNAIYFKDRQSKFLRVSTAFGKKFGFNDPGELVGFSDFDFFTEEHARPAYETEMEIIRSGQPIFDLEEKETHEDGSVTWVSTSKMPLYQDDGSIVGTFGISRDITKTKMVGE